MRLRKAEAGLGGPFLHAGAVRVRPALEGDLVMGIGRSLLERALLFTAVCSSLATFASGQAASDRSQFVTVEAPVVALKGVRVIDGTGSAPREGQTIVIAGGKIKAVGTSVEVPTAAKVIDLTGRTVTPGLVMLHEHLNYFSGRAVWHSQPVSYPKLFLAAGVTTIRTAGSEQPEVDLNLKRRIDEGRVAGPKIHLTGPYFNGPGGDFLGDVVVRDAEEGRAAAAFWASRGFTSFKLYSAIEASAARAIIEEARRRGVRVAGHLGSISCKEAADFGIYSIEHSFASCSKDLGADPMKPGFKADPSDPKFQELVRHLVKAGVVLVATPAAFDRPLTAEELDMLHPHERERYLRAAVAPPPWWPDSASGPEQRKLERVFVAAGGRLGVGSDANDFGHIAGYGNHRALALLVEAGWQPLEVIRLVTSNGAELLGVGQSVGRVAPGWAADLIVVSGDPAKDIKELSKAEIVFKDGVGYDPAKLRAAAKGLVGWH
jgi:imidazolonepropionase-like amidohydrolase